MKEIELVAGGEIRDGDAPPQVRQFPPLLVTRLTIYLSTAHLPPLSSLDTHSNFNFVSLSF
ncbi:hypothetical protein K439DRAFT_1643196 [Ramaria rubella]|nr:hypothetical protein K439DRAFT_1643196 [Ramaria rubella]